jgi:hypothetical protein
LLNLIYFVTASKESTKLCWYFLLYSSFLLHWFISFVEYLVVYCVLFLAS